MPKFIKPKSPIINWTSDIAAEMLKQSNIKYISLVPGASYRGLHDSIVNYLGNKDPQIILCLTEQSAVAIAHGYAKVTGEPMAVALHANIGVMHASINIFDAFADRVPVVIIGATGPVDANKRRPWIDWIHTSSDQGGLVRDFLKWDDQPTSAEAIAESVLRATLMSKTAPMGPTYVCLDAELQEKKIIKKIELPEPKYYQSGEPPGPNKEDLKLTIDKLNKSKKTVILSGRVSRNIKDWKNRIKLAEILNAKVYSTIKLATSFPTSHELHQETLHIYQDKKQMEHLCEADVILSLDWPDIKTTLEVIDRSKDDSLTVIHSSLDRYAHTGAVMDYLGLPRTDIMLIADPDKTTNALLENLKRINPSPSKPSKNHNDISIKTKNHNNTISMQTFAITVTNSIKDIDTTFSCLPFGWPIEISNFDHPLDYLGADAGGVIGAGLAFSIGASLGMRENNEKRLVICATGDGDFLSGMASLWTASQHKLPILAIINNNRSFMNDEKHQEKVAQIRGRPRENKWVGQRLDDPPPDICGIAKSQGWDSIGPINDIPSLEKAIHKGIDTAKRGNPTLIDVLVDPNINN